MHLFYSLQFPDTSFNFARMFKLLSLFSFTKPSKDAEWRMCGLDQAAGSSPKSNPDMVLYLGCCSCCHSSKHMHLEPHAARQGVQFLPVGFCLGSSFSVCLCVPDESCAGIAWFCRGSRAFCLIYFQKSWFLVWNCHVISNPQGF